jgi:hypothetical protein
MKHEEKEGLAHLVHAFSPAALFTFSLSLHSFVSFKYMSACLQFWQVRACA